VVRRLSIISMQAPRVRYSTSTWTRITHHPGIEKCHGIEAYLCPPQNKRARPMVPSDLPYTSEEEMLADQFARNSGLVIECSRHSGQFYRAYNRLETINRIDSCVKDKSDRLLELIKRNDLQKKALVVITLRNYPDECPLCKMH
jgi:hypothetical protein